MGEHHTPRAVRHIPGSTGKLRRIIREQPIHERRKAPVAFSNEAGARRAIARAERWVASHGEVVRPPRHIAENAELAKHWLAAHRLPA
jgi:hypothetical protein